MPDFPSSPLPERLRDGLDRLASLQRLEQWRASGAQGLNPTQLAILRRLDGSGLRVQAIARALGLSQPTVTDSLAALERKGLIARQSDPQDGRASLLHLTGTGRAALQTARGEMTLIDRALAALSPQEQTALLTITIKMIRTLLDDGQMPVQRMCVTCRYFRPHRSEGTSTPHYCEFVKAPFGANELRLDCGDHDAAQSDHQAATWRKFIAGVPGSGQNHHEETIE